MIYQKSEDVKRFLCSVKYFFYYQSRDAKSLNVLPIVLIKSFLARVSNVLSNAMIHVLLAEDKGRRISHVLSIALLHVLWVKNKVDFQQSIRSKEI